MFKFISKLVGSSKPAITSGSQDLDDRTAQEHGKFKYDRSGTSSEPLTDLWTDVAYLSNPENRFLNPQYSPMSRMPCADFTGFIVDRLRNKDLISIRQLMNAIIARNPGLGIGPSWMDIQVNNIAEMDISRYYNCPNEDFILELKSLFIIRSKDGGGREFWLTDYTPLLFSYSLCCHQIQWLEKLTELKDKAENFIKSMKEDAPFWRTYQLPGQTKVPLPSEVDYPVVSTLCKLPPLSRLHLMSFVEKGSTSLMHSTVYSMRSLGLNAVQTAATILDSGLCEKAVDQEWLLKILSKNDLFAGLNERKISYKQSWKKAELLQALVSEAPDLLEQVAEREKIVRIKVECLPQLKSILAYANSLEAPLSYLCFA
jgi:hypothetical protein